MLDEAFAKILIQVEEMSKPESIDELENLTAIVKGKIRKHAGHPVGNVPAPISSRVAGIASQLDTLSTSDLASLEAILMGDLNALGVKVPR